MFRATSIRRREHSPSGGRTAQLLNDNRSAEPEGTIQTAMGLPACTDHSAFSLFVLFTFSYFSFYIFCYLAFLCFSFLLPVRCPCLLSTCSSLLSSVSLVSALLSSFTFSFAFLFSSSFASCFVLLFVFVFVFFSLSLLAYRCFRPYRSNASVDPD
jgi:hypothetical protein